MEKPRRPVDLPLTRIRLPIGGIISILHRITGVMLVLLLPVVIYWWDKSLTSEAAFQQARLVVASTPVKLLWLLVAAFFIQHLVSGVRHLLLDLHIGLDKSAARKTAWAVPLVSLGLIALVAVAVF